MMKLGIFGYGVVGGGVGRIADKRQDMEVCKILVLPHEKDVDSRTVTDVNEIISDKTIDTVVEVMGGVHPAFEFVSAALKAGKNVVTANKALVAAYYNELLASEEMLRGVLKEELIAIRDKFGDKRRTEIQDVEDEIDIEDLIEEETCIYTLTNAGYIKRMSLDTYAAQRRGGKGKRGMATREEDYVETIFTASTHDNILFFTNFGKVYCKKGYLIPEAGSAAKGTNIVNILPLEPGEKVNTMIHGRGFPDDRYLVFVTKGGTVKRLCSSELKNIRRSGLRALNLVEGDELISVRETDGNQNILIATHDGYAICFNENDARPMGRTAAGVRGITLREGDYCVGAARAREEGSLLSVTENGYGKRTALSEYIRGEGNEPQKRGGRGMKNYQVTEKTGKVAAIKVVDDADDILLVADNGIVIRMAAADINTYGRATQGVRLMTVSDGAKVISLARTEREENTEETAETPAEE